MTAIVGAVSEQLVVLGADSMGSDGWSGRAYRNPKLGTHPVTHVDGSTVTKLDLGFGITGSFRFGQVLATHITPPDDHQSDAWTYIVKDFVPHLRKQMGEHGYLTKKDDVESIGGAALLAYRGRLFELQTDLSVIEAAEPFNAAGSGYLVALGAMSHAYTTILQPEDLCRAGLTAAASLITSVGPPFHFTHIRHHNGGPES